jgi:glycerophosphoryl diester phosphodiesterase
MHFFVSSFNHPELFAFHQLVPEVPTGALLAGIPLRYASFAEDIEATHVVLHYQAVIPAFIQDARHRGLKVFAFSVDDVKEMKRLVEMGVDGLITNYPDRAKSLQSRRP